MLLRVLFLCLFFAASLADDAQTPLDAGRLENTEILVPTEPRYNLTYTCSLLPKEGVIVYVLYHDTPSYTVARERFKHMSWARLLFVLSTIFNEAGVYLEALRARQLEWACARFVGTISWHALDKLRLPISFDALADEAEAGGVKVVPFLAGLQRKESDFYYPAALKILDHAWPGYIALVAVAQMPHDVFYCSVRLSWP